jgi:formylglycine-generating enzyme required for sulfatase activity
LNLIRLISISFSLATLLLFSICEPSGVSAGQGKSGEVVAKPTPTPKKTTPKKTAPAKTTSGSKTTQPAKSADDDATTAEIVFWNSIKDSTNPDDFKEYLKKYPNGEFAGLARNKLKTLEASQPKPEASPAATKETVPNAGRTGAKTDDKDKSPPNPGTVVKNSIGMEMIWVPSGEFMMGSTDAELDEAGTKLNAGITSVDEKPKHKVIFRQGFWMGKYEVTIGQWKAVMGDIPEVLKRADYSKFRESDYQPIVYVSWENAKEFIAKLNAKNDGFEYSLPSEAQWEYAARAGTTTIFSFGDSFSTSQANCASFSDTFFRNPVEVGSYKPNPWGLYDMHGNVFELTEDYYSSSYRSLPTDGTANTVMGNYPGDPLRVMRGGTWGGHFLGCRSAARNNTGQKTPAFQVGFRVVAQTREKS